VSNTAGTYLCNQVLYLALHWAAQQKQNIPTGFIHVPSLPEQVIEMSNAPSMALSTALLAIRTTLETLLTTLI